MHKRTNWIRARILHSDHRTNTRNQELRFQQFNHPGGFYGFRISDDAIAGWAWLGGLSFNIQAQILIMNFNFATLQASDFFGLMIIMVFIDFVFMSLIYGFSRFKRRFGR